MEEVLYYPSPVPLTVRWQALEGLPKRSGEVSMDDFSLYVGLPIPFTAEVIHAELNM